VGGLPWTSAAYVLDGQTYELTKVADQSTSVVALPQGGGGVEYAWMESEFSGVYDAEGRELRDLYVVFEGGGRKLIVEDALYPEGRLFAIGEGYAVSWTAGNIKVMGRVLGGRATLICRYLV